MKTKEQIGDVVLRGSDDWLVFYTDAAGNWFWMSTEVAGEWCQEPPLDDSVPEYVLEVGRRMLRNGRRGEPSEFADDLQRNFGG